MHLVLTCSALRYSAEAYTRRRRSYTLALHRSQTRLASLLQQPVAASQLTSSSFSLLVVPSTTLSSMSTGLIQRRT